MAVQPITGTAGNDNLSGTAGGDIFRLRQGGDDTASGLAGDDVFWMRDAFTALDALDGGDDVDKVILRGDYSAGVGFSATTLTNVEVLRLGGAFDYRLTTHDATVAAGAHFTLTTASDVGSVVFDGSAETDGSFRIFAGAGDNAFTGGAKGDRFFLNAGGFDTAYGGGGKDTFYLAAAFTDADLINGGAGNDTMVLNGTYSGPFVFTATMMTNVEILKLLGSGYYSLQFDDGNVAAGKTLTVDASALSGGFGYRFDGSAETDGAFHYIGGGVEYPEFYGGAGDDTIDMGSVGEGYAYGGGGGDTIIFGAGFNNKYTEAHGGSGSNTLILDGASGDDLGEGDVDDIQTVVFLNNAYTGVTVTDDIAGGQTLTIDASGLTAAQALEIDLTNATSVGYAITGGAGDDTITRGVLTFDDAIAGGAGYDTLNITEIVENGADSLSLGATTITGIDKIVFADFTFEIITDDANVAAGETLELDMSACINGNTEWLGGAETDGHFDMTGGHFGGRLVGGAQSDTFTLLPNTWGYAVTGGGGSDDITCSTSGEFLIYSSAAQSSSTYRDIIHGINFDADQIDTEVAVTAVLAGAAELNAATFDADMGFVLDDGFSVRVMTANAGDLIGHVYLVIEADGSGNYSAGGDYVMDITGFTGTIDTSDFI